MLYRYNKIILLNSTVADTLCQNLDHLGKLLLIKGLLVYKTIQQFCSLADLSYKNVSITQAPVTTKSSWCFPLVFIAPSIELCQISADMHTFSLFCFIFITMSNFCSSSIFLCCVIIIMNKKVAIMLLWYQKKEEVSHDAIVQKNGLQCWFFND